VYDKFYERVYKGFYARIQDAMKEVAAINDGEEGS
jgi:hypothetical protein